jgi:hypothetical protein
MQIFLSYRKISPQRSKWKIIFFFFNEVSVDKPFLVRKYVVSYGYALLKLRKKCNGVFPACFLMDSFVKTKVLSREFSSTIEIESECLNRSILEDLKGEK